MADRATEAPGVRATGEVLYSAPSGRRFTDAAELAREYDIEATVPDFPAVAAGFVTRSADTRSRLECVLDLPYGPTVDERLDVFPGAPGGPVVVFLHGGYWRALTAAEFSFVAEGPVKRGATVVVPTYSLCPAVTIDEIVRQERAAFAWTVRHIEEYGADPRRIVVAGHSAGGHGVAAVLSTRWRENYGLDPAVVRGGCAISGLFDLRPLPYTAVQADLRLTADQVLRNSPLLTVPETMPPLVVSYGTEQPAEFVRQSTDYAAALLARGLPVSVLARPGFDHFDELTALSTPDSDLTDAILDLAR
ncbi:alpha/beta hydrolase [Amycolatopsis rhabdoformis]|uniref:Alpha/beta hydrolase n=1 Tax=Amycolatopsis rhabdoformis TaxID=1448059 RepID=A0ABZ1IK79_9PSEU|nr:alpha/beta hydrolase [Amycolatopsis rhabdoformis]WSE34163.1 alpha/beta hydrolase [Amycolatopsis rhabdoformis]